MAELTPVRIPELTEQFPPLSGYSVMADKDGEATAVRIDLSKIMLMDDPTPISIGAWNMAATALKAVSISNAETVAYISKIEIFDDDGFLFDSGTLFDMYIHQAVRNVGQSASKTVSISGNTGNAAAGTTASGTANGTTGPTALSGNTNSNSTGDRKLLGVVHVNANSSANTQYFAEDEIGTISCLKDSDYRAISHGYAGEVQAFVTNLSGQSLMQSVETITAEKKIYVRFHTYEAVSAFPAFYIHIYAPHVSDSHVHAISLLEHTHSFSDSHVHPITTVHAHTIAGSGSTGIIISSSGMRYKNVGVIYRYNPSTGVVQMTHNACDNDQTAMSDFGVFSVNSNPAVMQKYTTRANRGYIWVKRRFVTP